MSNSEKRRFQRFGGRGLAGVVVALAGVVVSAGGIGGCSGPSKVDYARVYPAKEQKQVVDVQVSRHVTEIELTNTSARDFPAATMWINAQFSKPIPELKIGKTMRLNLYDFRNEYSEAFRAGGFFSTVRPDEVVLAQIELPDEMVGLIVVKGKER